jgi:hypothetical protein
MAAKGGRRGWLVGLLLFAAGAAVVALVAAGRRPIAERLLLWQLREHGIAPASLWVERVGPRALAIRDLRIGDADLTLDRLELGYDWRGLIGGRLDALRLEGLQVRGALREGELRFGALDALRGDGAGVPGSPRLPTLPFARLEIDDATLALDTEEGRFEAVAEIVLDAAGDGRFTLRSTSLEALDTALGIAAEPFAWAGSVAFRPDRVEIRLAPAPFSLTLAREGGSEQIVGVTPTVRLRGSPEGLATLRIKASGGEVALRNAGLEARGLALEARVDPDTRLPEGRFAIDRLRDLRAETPIPPLALEARFEPEGDAIAFDGRIESESPRVAVHLRGAHDLRKGRGRSELDLDPVEFQVGGLQPSDLLPELARWISSAGGTLDGHGEIRWGEGVATGHFDLGLRDLRFATPAAELEQLNAVLRVDGLWPPRVAPGQLVSMARVDFGLELTDGLVAYSVDPDGVVELESATWHFAGGVIRTGGALDLFADERHLLIAVEDVDLAELLELVNLEGLSGTGRIGGRLPLVLSDGTVEIREAVLTSAAEGGWLRYQPAPGKAALVPGVEVALDDLLAALRNFHYERLTLRVNGDAQGSVVVSLSLLGANPDHRDGQPYDFNLNVEGRLVDLVRKGSVAYAIPQQIEERLRAITEARR